MEKPSLALIPTGYKDGKLYSVLPENGVGDFDVVRGSGATRVNKEGLVESMANNTPRLDYTGGGCPSLLLEPLSTNLVTYSEDFSNASWVKSDTIVSNGVVAPSGSNEAFNLLADNVTNQAYVNVNVSVTTSQTYTFSVFAKQGAEKYIALANLNPYTSSFFDLESGVALGSTAVSSSIEDYGNGWFRCSVETTADTTTKFCGVYLSDNGTTLISSSIPNGNGVQIWGAQLEPLPYATSYIPTSGAIASRLADSVTGAGDVNTFNSTEGVLYFEGSALTNGGSERYISLSDNTDSNYVQLILHAIDNRMVFRVKSGGVAQVNIDDYTFEQTDNLKIACVYKQNNFSLWINGVERATDFSGNIPIGLSKLDFSLFNGNVPFYGKVKDLRVYNTALTDAELIELTTI